MNNKKKVLVCAECLRASCWQGIFMCDKARTADIVEKDVEELKRLKLENPDYWNN